MPARRTVPKLSTSEARAIWLRAQGLDTAVPFGTGAEATSAAVAHLGYVQIDTINVIERSHHHILFTRIPSYRRAHLAQAQSTDKSVFEYWTHALSYAPSKDIGFFLPEMKRHRQFPSAWFSSVTKKDLNRLLARIREDGPLSIRDIDDEMLVEKDHPWASRKPSKRVLQFGFYCGLLAVSRRSGMLKTYELLDRHFGWETRPKPATEKQVAEYVLLRALRAQGVVSLDSICHLDAGRKPAVRAIIESRVRRKLLVPVTIDGAEKVAHWIEPATMDGVSERMDEIVHILSPFDPLVIQRKRLNMLFGYEHRFEAYVPKEKRVLGYFALPVLIGDRIVAALDLKADRGKGKLMIQKWTWLGGGSKKNHKPAIDEALQRFERFQFET